MDSFKKIIQILEILTKNTHSSVEIDEMGIKGSLELLVSIEKMSFISKVGVDSLRISQIKWGITQSGKSFLKIYNKEKEIHNFGIVMTIPPPQSHTFFEKHPKIKKTEIAFKELFANAEKEIRILSPYIDASIINFFEKIQPNVSVRIITLPNQFSSKNAILERLKSKINLNVKYIKQVREGAQLYQIHAKIILVDGKFIYIGSANFKDTSIYYNLEAGLVSEDEFLIKKYGEIYDDLYENYASP